MSLSDSSAVKIVHDGRMDTIMKLDQLKDVEQLKLFLDGSQALMFEVPGVKQQRYEFVRGQLEKFRYRALKKTEKGLVIRFLIKVSGYSRQQMTRLIGRYVQTGKLAPKQRTAIPFRTKYTPEDIRLLAALDERHNTPSGATAKKLCERAFLVFSDSRYERLADISVGHLYNLRKCTGYRRQRFLVTKTRPTKSTLGTRKKPKPQGRPGFIRIDTVHQGDWDKSKGVYHINAVDEVTQYEIIVSVQGISESFLMPALEALLDAFPFEIQGFHSDNGSEYINKRVARLLEKLNIEFTKSRARRSNDNGLVESKNAAVIRKSFGHAHIPQKYASQINEFNQDYLNDYVNFHRPCYFPEKIMDEKGKIRVKYHYRDMMTPYEKLKSIHNATQYLKPLISFESLDEKAYALSDDQAADAMNAAQKLLWSQMTLTPSSQTA